MAGRKNYRRSRAAVVAACEALLFKSGLDKEEADDLRILKLGLKPLIWEYGEATPYGGGKYTGCENWSKRALDCYNSNRSGYKKCVELHHFSSRDKISEELIKADTLAAIRRILKQSKTCVLLRKEHSDYQKMASEELEARLVSGPRAGSQSK
jgi:hypothetical protein